MRKELEENGFQFGGPSLETDGASAQTSGNETKETPGVGKGLEDPILTHFGPKNKNPRRVFASYQSVCMAKVRENQELLHRFVSGAEVVSFNSRQAACLAAMVTDLRDQSRVQMHGADLGQHES